MPIDPTSGAAPRRRSRLAALALAALLAGPATAEPDAEACLACHGGPGGPADPIAPALGGQPEMFLLYQMVFFRDGQRKAEPMSSQMQGLSNADLTALARRLATLPPSAPDPALRDAERFARGEALARAHRCGICHLADYAGARHVPRLAGQREAYLRHALQDFREGRRIGIQAAMAEVLSGLDAAALDDLAHYLSQVDG